MHDIENDIENILKDSVDENMKIKCIEIKGWDECKNLTPEGYLNCGKCDVLKLLAKKIWDTISADRNDILEDNIKKENNQ